MAKYKDIPSIEVLMKLVQCVGPKDIDINSLETTFLFLRTIDEVMNAYNTHFEKFGISDAKFHVLAVYWLHELQSGDQLPPTPSQIAEMGRVNRSTITGILDGLERAGLVTRTPHPNDRRALQIKLTKAGHQLMEEIFPVHIRRSAALFKGISPEKQAFLVSILQEILSGLDNFETEKNS